MKRIETLQRDTSVLDGGTDLTKLYSVRDFPVFFGCVDTPPEDDQFADMDWVIQESTGMIQLAGLLPPEVAYSAQHVDGTGKTWENFYKYFADYILRSKTKDVLEIGGGSGNLARVALANNEDLRWTVVEPNPLIETSSRLKVISGFFDDNFRYSGEFDTIVLSHTLEHIYDPRKFLNDTAEFLGEGKRLILAIPNLESWLRAKFTNALNFEHHMYLTDYFFEYMAHCSGLTVMDKVAYEDHSYIYTLEKGVRQQISKPNRAAETKADFLEFYSYHRELVDRLNTELKSGEKAYLFGAHIFSSFLIYLGLDLKNICGVIDNSPLKVGRRLYGTNYIVQSPKVISGEQNPRVVVKVGVHRSSVVSQLNDLNERIQIIE